MALGLFRFLGRLLFVSSFVFMAYNIINDQQFAQKDAKQLSQNYPKFYNWVMTDLQVQKHVGQHIPKGFIEPEVINANANVITKYKAFFIFAATTLIVLGSCCGGFLLYIYQILNILINFNPLLASGKFNYIRDSYALIPQVALAAGALLMCCGFSRSGGQSSCPIAPKKQAKTTPQPTSSQKPSKQNKQKKN